MRMPVVSLGGTDRDTLIRFQRAVVDAAAYLQTALEAAAPHSRDYAPGDYPVVREEHVAMHCQVTEIRAHAARLVEFLEGTRPAPVVAVTPIPQDAGIMPATVEQAVKRLQLIARWEREGRLVPGCPGCNEFYNAPDPLGVLAPRHSASKTCESGKRPHCSCDICF